VSTSSLRAWAGTAFAAALFLLVAAPLAAQFRDDFDGPLVKDREGAKGWGVVTGEGAATMDFIAGPGYATIAVDATSVYFTDLQATGPSSSAGTLNKVAR